MTKRWDIVVIGNLSRNRYWGEGDERAVRPALCTGTLVQGDGFRLLVDPPIGDRERMAAELERRTGLKPADIEVVFLTHEHGDHHAGLVNFPSAEWLAAAPVAEAINAAGAYARPVRAAAGRPVGDIEVIPTPGHTPGHHSLRFDCGGLSVVVAGDAVMTRDFWADRRGFHNSTDPVQATRTIEDLARIADAVVPGHDNWFLARPSR